MLPGQKIQNGCHGVPKWATWALSKSNDNLGGAIEKYPNKEKSPKRRGMGWGAEVEKIFFFLQVGHQRQIFSVIFISFDKVLALHTVYT